MQIILLKNVPKVGQKYEVKEVSNGYALNFLLPKGLAKKATPEEVEKLEQERKQKRKIDARHTGELLEKLRAVKDKPIKISAKANEKGHLFKGIGKDDLIQAIFRSTGFNLSPESIILEKPLKETGEFRIKISAAGAEEEIVVYIVAEK